jgi:hypothetical protein
MDTTTLYRHNKQEIISNFLGAKDGIDSLENVIRIQPNITQAEHGRNGYVVYNNQRYAKYKKTAYPMVYDRFMNKKDAITIFYLVNINNNDIILMDIY